jgi:hypothetical protein
MRHQSANEIRQVLCLLDISLEPAVELHEISGIEKQHPDVSKRDLGHY